MTVSVIAVLISLLTPALSSVRETAHQVICRSNVRQLGLGISMYAEEHKDRVPPTQFTNEPWETNTLRYGPRANLPQGGWDGLGLLYSPGEEYLVAPKLFYCPSHKGNHPFINYEESWASDVGQLRGNYQYRGRAPKAGSPGQNTDYLPDMVAGAALVTDCIRTQTDFNHQVGSNVFRAGSVVAWFSDREGTFLQSLPKDGDLPGAGQFQNFWNDLDDR